MYTRAAGRIARAKHPESGWLSPMLATLTQETPPSSGWSFERKYDGYRAICIVTSQDARLYSRNRLDLGDDFPGIVAALKSQALLPCIVDGEVIAMSGGKSSFSALQRRAFLHETDLSAKFQLVLFDVLALDGHATTRLPLEERRGLLREAMEWNSVVRLSPALRGTGATLLKRACEKGWEGLIGKRVGSTYEHRRSGNWQKFKCQQRQEFVIGGYSEPQGSRQGFGALLIGYFDAQGGFCYAGKVGTGFDEARLTSIFDLLRASETTKSPFAIGDPPKGSHWVRPELVAEVSFTEWTPDGHLRHPVFEGLRPNKQPHQVQREYPQP